MYATETHHGRVAHLSHSRRVPQKKAGCPISRVLCEKWGFWLIAHHKSRPVTLFARHRHDLHLRVGFLDALGLEALLRHGNKPSGQECPLHRIPHFITWSCYRRKRLELVGAENSAERWLRLVGCRPKAPLLAKNARNGAPGKEREKWGTRHPGTRHPHPRYFDFVVDARSNPRIPFRRSSWLVPLFIRHRHDLPSLRRVSSCLGA